MPANAAHPAPDKVVILARGLGTRMRREDPSAALTLQQQAAAVEGSKAMMPLDRPFLDYLLHLLAEAGLRRACLVVAPDHREIRGHVDRLAPRRISVDYAVQDQPRGTADAVLAAEGFASGDEFICINSDNYYPLCALRRLRELDGPGLAAFDRAALLRGNIPAQRISRFAVLELDRDGALRRIIEKPTGRQIRRLGEPVRVSMNCWRFGPTIFDACRRVRPSARGELELPDAVQAAIRAGEVFRAVVVDQPVLDLSSRADVAAVMRQLAGTRVDL